MLYLDGPRALRIRIYAFIEALDQAGGEASPRPAGKVKGFLKQPLSLAHGNEMLSRGPRRARSTARQMGMVICRPRWLAAPPYSRRSTRTSAIGRRTSSPPGAAWR